MNQLLSVIAFSTLISSIFSVRIFLMGGDITDTNIQIFEALSQSTSKTPQPSKCSEDWSRTSCPKIAVATSAAANQTIGTERFYNDSSSLSYQHLFLKYGMAPKLLKMHIGTYELNGSPKSSAYSENIQIIEQADIIFFNEGDQAKHARSWLFNNGTFSLLFSKIAIKALKNEVVLAGTSAGSMIMCEQTLGGGNAFGVWDFAISVGLAPKSVKDGGVNGTGLSDVRNGTQGLQYDNNGGKMPGFHMFDYQTDAHLGAQGRLGRIVPVLVDMGKDVGIGVDEDTCLDFNNGIGKVFGDNGVFIVDISGTQRAQSHAYFQLKNVTVHYLTSKDSYNFGTRLVSSSKPLIKSPQYKSPTDSTDILQPYQCTLLLTRLVDQTAAYNVGKTKRPSGYGLETPTFEMVFYKNSNTKGYFSDGKYTVDRAIVDYQYLGSLEGLLANLREEAEVQ